MFQEGNFFLQALRVKIFFVATKSRQKVPLRKQSPREGRSMFLFDFFCKNLLIYIGKKSRSLKGLSLVVFWSYKQSKLARALWTPPPGPRRVKRHWFWILFKNKNICGGDKRKCKRLNPWISFASYKLEEWMIPFWNHNKKVKFLWYFWWSMDQGKTFSPKWSKFFILVHRPSKIF